MLADVIVGAVLLVLPVHPLVARKGHVLLVHGPRDAAVLEQVDERRHVSISPVEVVVLHAKVVARNGSHVVWLRGVRHSKVVGERDALGGNPFEVG